MLQNVYFPQETYFLILSYLVQAIQLVQNSEFYYGGGILYTGVKSARQDKNSNHLQLHVYLLALMQTSDFSSD